jgi:hypothetical protein
VEGGDLVFTKTEFSGEILWLANRTTGTLYNISQGGSLELPLDEINGVSVTEDGQLLFANGASGPAGGLYLYDTVADELNQLATSGAPSAFFNGDLAAGCVNSPYYPLQGECYATDVLDYTEGLNINDGFIAPERADAQQAKGAPQRTDGLVFTTLGYHGSITLTFDGIVPNSDGYDLEIVETSFGTPGCQAYPEYADVYVSLDDESYLLAGTVCKGEPFIDISDASEALYYVNYVKVVNNNELTGTFDGFDLDGVKALHNCEGIEEAESTPLEQFAWGDRNGLLTAHPNPSTGASNVTFKVREAGKSVLEVFDTSGRSVAMIYSGDTEAGLEYKFQFDGGRLTDGMYIYKLTTNTETVVRRFLISR